MDAIIGKKIEGRYLVKELVGVGGMANVYKAVDTFDGKIVAVKLLREEFYENEEFLRRFKNESKAIAMLSHPNIIEVYDVCFTHSMRCIVMEYIDGITLKEYLDERKPLPYKEALHFLQQVLEGLSHAHSKGIIHRDIKPQNVLLLVDGSIKITDFGIARFTRSEAKTLTDRAIGSVHYISPEQARGEHTDQCSDIYSVGVMLFEMLTGQLPFDADSPVSVALKQIELEAPSPRNINPDIPEALEEITIRAMQKSPKRRYASAVEMLEDIKRFKENPSVKFEYLYLTNNNVQEDKMRKTVEKAKSNVRNSKTAEPAPKKRRTVKPAYDQTEEPKAKRERRPSKGPSIVTALAGITAAFVIVTVVYVAAMFYFNNPLEKVPDVIMPDIVGQHYDAVKNSQVYANFTIEVEGSEYNEMYERGEIISQRPKAGTKVKENSIIKLTVSNGTKVVLMPNLIGYEETVAYRELVLLGLDYQKVEVFSSAPVGTVVATDPGYGSEIAASTVVSVQISMGEENKISTVPNIVGMNLNDARAALAAQQLNVGGISYISSSEPADTVISQDPAPTSQVQSGSFVNINVSGGEEIKTQVTLNIPLTQSEEIVKLQAMYNGQVLREDRLQPSTAGTWRPMFEGTGTVTIFILYNDFLYHTYEINFTTGSYTLIEDNSSMHT